MGFRRGLRMNTPKALNIAQYNQAANLLSECITGYGFLRMVLMTNNMITST